MEKMIPIIDYAKISESPELTGKLLLQACCDWGFFYIDNHPISVEDVDQVFSISHHFFAQDAAAKATVPYDAARNMGFRPPTAGFPRESFSMNKFPTDTALSAANLPPILRDYKPQIWKFQQQCHALAIELLELISLALGLPARTFTSQHPFNTPNFDNFEIMHYPPIPPTISDPAGAVKYRIVPHTDWGSLTLLFMPNRNPVPGLQIRPPSYASPTLDLDMEEWTPALAIPGAILINVADMLEFWSAGRLKSTWHRVIPPPAEFSHLGRYCIAYFLHPRTDVTLEPIKSLEKVGWKPRYEGRGRTAEEHIRARIRGPTAESSPKSDKDC